MAYICAIHGTESRNIRTQTGGITICDECNAEREQRAVNAKPRKGQQVRYTEKGAGFHYQIHGCWPPKMNGDCHGVLGEVISVSGSVAKIRLPFGGVSEFIWRFRDGPNDCFEWNNEQSPKQHKEG